MEQTIYVNGYGKRDGRYHTQLILTNIQAVRLIRLLAEALDIMDADDRIRLTINHGIVAEGIDRDANSEWLGVITDAPRLK